MKTLVLESLRSLVLNASIKTPTETLANPETNHVNVVKKAGQQMQMQYYSGSDMTILSRQDYQYVGALSLTPSTVRAIVANNHPLKLDSYFNSTIGCADGSKCLDIHVADVPWSLLGLDFCNSLTLHIALSTKPQRGSTPVYDINRRKTNVKPKAAHGRSPGTKVSLAVLQTSVNTRQKGAAPDAPRSRCPGCDGAHWKKDCPYKNSKCYTCEGLGHIAEVCPNGGRKNDAAAAQNSSCVRRSRKNVRSVNVNSVKIWEPPSFSNESGKKDESRYGTKVSSVKIYSLRTQAAARRRYIVPVMIADESLYFDSDSGSDVTVLSRRDYQVIGSHAMAPARIEARTASNSKMVFDGYFKTSVICSNIAKHMDIYVSDMSCSVLGLDSTGHDSTIAQVSSHPIEGIVTVAAPA
uniref:CCHC-type domain-containing protein n=1 Tax=Panagrolaimus sp. PS1159 TaxID=55785 RepID=A0AC35GCX8_9BILA